eukprot:TRINITY_DN5950_c0_g2_i1.p1 TRINITY_DN5950_c0_g2~~TRINITY_DN5950_c0_g2_i1.p1  ORF type:complete len:485 (+),score=193.00 TRINITY_DN5950_c0_g2_i1:127-1581(+)
MFKASVASKAERAILAQRGQTEALRSLQSKLREESKMKIFADWENRGREVQKTIEDKRKFAEMREEAKKAIDMRRAKLAHLLKNEEEEYDREMKAMQETPKQIRDKMVQRVQELRESREVSRRAEVEKKLEQRFRENTDELRKIESEINEQKSLHERDLQMMEKQKSALQNFDEESIYAELWRREKLKRDREDEAEQKRRRDAIEMQRQSLAFQVEQNEATRAEAYRLKEHEKAMLREQWKEEEERQKLQEREQAMLSMELNADLIEHYRALSRQKEEEIKREKDADKEFIARTIAREKALQELEQEERARVRKETHDYLWNFKNRTDEYHTHEQELERIVREENEKQWRKREEQWKKEEDARIKLLYDVYRNREADVMKKRQEREEEERLALQEKTVVNQSLKSFEADEEKRKREKYEKMKQYQQELQKQIAEKAERKQMSEKQRLARELRDIEEEKELMHRIEEERRKGRKMVEDLRSKKPF